MDNGNERNVRFNLPEDIYSRLMKIQGLFSFKEGKKVSMQDTYTRVLERGSNEILKHNK